MPGGDGTGPFGDGQMTGRGAGICAGNNRPGYTSSGGRGRGMGRGLGSGFSAFAPRGFFGRGRGNRNQFYATGMPGWQRYGNRPTYQSMSKEDEIQYLNDQADYFKRSMDDVNRILKELQGEKETEGQNDQ